LNTISKFIYQLKDTLANEMAKRSVIPVLGRLRQEDLELDNSLCYIMMPCFKQKKKKAMKERRKRKKE
jgi:hypothetical protein